MQIDIEKLKTTCKDSYSKLPQIVKDLAVGAGVMLSVACIVSFFVYLDTNYPRILFGGFALLVFGIISLCIGNTLNDHIAKQERLKNPVTMKPRQIPPMPRVKPPKDE